MAIADYNNADVIIKRCVTFVPGSRVTHSLLNSRPVNAELFYLRQIFLGTFDMRVHCATLMKVSKNRRPLHHCIYY